MSDDVILVLNAGSSSLKFGLYRCVNAAACVPVCRGQIDGIGTSPRMSASDATGRKLTVPALDGNLVDVSAALARLSTMLLLQERDPRAAVLFAHTAELVVMRATSAEPEVPVRVLRSADTPIPEVQLLSNGRYHVMVTNAGGGYSRWKDLSVTRWREDTTCDHWGTFCYLRDVDSGAYWSTAHQPTLVRPTHYEAIFSEGRAEFRRHDHEVDAHTEIVVSPEEDIELRRVHITNRSRERRTLDVTSYAEVVLAPQVYLSENAFIDLLISSAEVL